MSLTLKGKESINVGAPSPDEEHFQHPRDLLRKMEVSNLETCQSMETSQHIMRPTVMT